MVTYATHRPEPTPRQASGYPRRVAATEIVHFPKEVYTGPAKA